MAEYVGTDFTKRKKDVIKFTLPVEAGSDEGFELSVMPPTKRVYDSLAVIAEQLVKIEDGKLEAESIDMGDVLGAVAEAMSHNLQHRKITVEYLDSIDFDIIDAGEFLGCYLFFITQLVEEKNSNAPGLTRETEA